MQWLSPEPNIRLDKSDGMRLPFFANYATMSIEDSGATDALPNNTVTQICTEQRRLEQRRLIPTEGLRNRSVDSLNDHGHIGESEEFLAPKLPSSR